jgi:hypothetical protein
MTTPFFIGLSARALRTPRATHHARWLRRREPVAKSRRRIALIAAVATALLASGCGVGSSSSGPGTDWMVKVQGDFANIYSYPDGTFPGTSARVNLGPSGGKNSATVSHAAASLGVPVANVTNVSGK